jgi:hypothetical protein
MPGKPPRASSSQAQHNLMAGVAHGWRPDQVKAPSVKVAQEFTQADKGKKFGSQERARQMAQAQALRRGR